MNGVVGTMTYYVFEPNDEHDLCIAEGHEKGWYDTVFELQGGSVKRGDFSLRKCTDYSTVAFCHNPGFVKISKEKAEELMHRQLETLNDMRKVLIYSLSQVDDDVDFED